MAWESLGMASMELKDKIGLTASLLALSISIISTYYTFRVNIHSSLVLPDDTVDLAFGKGGLSNISYSPDLTFINDGNRPTAILGLMLSVRGVKKLDYKRENCDFASGEAFSGIGIRPTPGSFSPVVVEPDKIAVVHAEFDGARPTDQPVLVMKGDSPSLLVTAREPSGSLNVVTCLEVRFTTSKGNIQSVNRPVFLARGDTRGKNEGGAEGDLGPFRGGRPIALVDERSQKSRDRNR